jgi:iron-sulfur cluster assembly protein
MSFGLTENAARRVREIMNSNDVGPGTHGVRLGVASGGCSGLSYVLAIEEPEDNDRIYESEVVRIFCDPKSYLYINGTKIDFSTDLLNGGFVFENPNVTRGCGCGTSFTVD